jgi:trans-2,3-dihydro-3-hydroxyanthranilate isomerase
VPADLAAACLGLRPDQVLTGTHRPVVASCGLGFAVAEVAPDALGTVTTDTGAFRRAMAAAPSREGGFSLLAYSRDGDAVRARMFAPLAGITEDPATGSAACALAALLLHAGDGDAHRLTIHQGVEMGRPSLLHAHASRGTDGVRAGVGGGAVTMFRGVVSL